MEELERKLGAILEDPEAMGKIMSLAQALSQEQPKAENPQPEADKQLFDTQTLQKLTSLAGKAGIDPKQKNLLHALSPYLNQNRIGRLEKAMRAARMAHLATSILGR